MGPGRQGPPAASCSTASALASCFARRSYQQVGSIQTEAVSANQAPRSRPSAPSRGLPGTTVPPLGDSTQTIPARHYTCKNTGKPLEPAITPCCKVEAGGSPDVFFLPRPRLGCHRFSPIAGRVKAVAIPHKPGIGASARIGRAGERRAHARIPYLARYLPAYSP